MSREVIIHGPGLGTDATLRLIADASDEEWQEETQTVRRAYVRGGKRVAVLDQSLVEREEICTRQNIASIMLPIPEDVATKPLQGGGQ